MAKVVDEKSRGDGWYQLTLRRYPFEEAKAMVDAIKTQSMDGADQCLDGRPAGAGTSPAAVAQTGETVKVSDAASSKVVAQLAEAPPVNTEAVRKIKDAISRGEYPINVDRISEALMDAYRDMKA